MKVKQYETPAVHLYELTTEGVMCESGESGDTESWSLQGLKWDDETE